MTSARRAGFKAELKKGLPIMFDGGMGSALYERGYFINRAFDECNLSDPQKVGEKEEKA